MKRKKSVLSGSLFLILTMNAQAANPRSELSRYIELRDKTIIDQSLRKNVYSNYFDLELNINSGTKELIGDINSSKDSSLGIAGVLNKNINSELFIDFNVEAAAPLPFIKIKKYRLLPNLVYNMNLGALLSFSTDDTGLVPSASVYVKKETKLGIYSRLKWNNRKSESIDFFLYKMTRSDLLYSRTATQVDAEDGIFDFGELEKSEKKLTLDLRYQREFSDYKYFIELKELPIMDMSSDKDSIYGKSPLIHARYSLINKENWGIWSPFVGLHYRKRYSAFEGLYVGSRFNFDTHIPVTLVTKLDTKFITIMPKLDYKYFYLNYSMRTPYRNPQEEVWVSATHSINLGVPF